MDSSFVDFVVGLAGNMTNDEIQKTLNSKDLSLDKMSLLIAFSHCIKLMPTDYAVVKKMTKKERQEMASIIAKLSFALGHEFAHRCETASIAPKDKNAHEHNHGII